MVTGNLVRQRVQSQYYIQNALDAQASPVQAHLAQRGRAQQAVRIGQRFDDFKVVIVLPNDDFAWLARSRQSIMKCIGLADELGRFQCTIG